jgi:hypothetical protein
MLAPPAWSIEATEQLAFEFISGEKIDLNKHHEYIHHRSTHR